jgi:kinesin family protein 3/17
MIQSGMDPTEIMKKHGVMGAKNIIEVEKVIQVEDKEKMREFEEKLQREKEEIRLRAEDERRRIEQEKNLKEEEKA